MMHLPLSEDDHPGFNAQAMATAIRFHQVSLRFGRKVVLDRFDLEVADGQKLQLTGPSGSGKSSVLRLLMGLERPDAGRIFIRGEALTEKTAWQLRQTLAYVSQDATLGQGRLREALQEVLRFRANAHLP
jgi:ABC-type bacteriocin/lantibiotic exporter with double-glycine peptidase domain